MNESLRSILMSLALQSIVQLGEYSSAVDRIAQNPEGGKPD